MSALSAHVIKCYCAEGTHINFRSLQTLGTSNSFFTKTPYALKTSTSEPKNGGLQFTDSFLCFRDHAVKKLLDRGDVMNHAHALAAGDDSPIQISVVVHPSGLFP